MQVRPRGLNQLFPISLVVAVDIPDVSPMSFDVTGDGTYLEIDAPLGLAFRGSSFAQRRPAAR